MKPDRFCSLAGWMLLILYLLAPQVQAATKVALVTSNNAQDSIRSVLDLATVRLTSEKEIALLERQEVARLLSEQKLSLSGLVDAERAVAAGKVLAADLLAAIEASADEKQAVGLIVFDSQTGLRLADETLPESAAEGAERIAEAIKLAVEKRRKPRGELRPVCVLSVRNADLPRAMDGPCQAISSLVQRSILHSANVALLERERLEHAAAERRLAAGQDDALWSALVLIDFEIAKKPGGNGYQVTTRLTNGDGQAIRRLVSAADIWNPREISDLVQKQLLPELGAVAGAKPFTAAREAQRYAVEARLLNAHNDFEQAIRASEVACSLAPDRKEYRNSLELHLLRSADDLLNPLGRKNAPPGSPRKRDPANIAPALAQASRALDLRLAALRETAPFDFQRLDKHQLAFWGSDVLAFATLYNLSTVRPVTPAERESVLEVRGKYRQFCLEASEAWANVVKMSPQNTFRYTNYLTLLWLPNAGYCSADKEEFFATREHLIQQWLDVLAAAGAVSSGNPDKSDLRIVINALLQKNIPFFERELGLDDAEFADRLGGLFTDMREHRHPVVRLFGEFGPLWQARAKGTLTVEQLETSFPELQEHAALVIANPGPEPTLQMRGEAYAAWLAAIKWLYDASLTRDKPTFGPARAARIVELCEFMAERGEYAPLVLSEALTWVDPKICGTAFDDRLLAAVERLGEWAEDPKFEIFGARPGDVRGLLNGARNGLRKRLSLSLEEKPRPWRSALQVLDCRQLPGTSFLQRGVLSGRTLYCLGANTANGAIVTSQVKNFHLVAIPLDGSAAKKLGEIPKPLVYDQYTIRDSALGGGVYCIAIKGTGIGVFSLDGSPARVLSTATGLPSNDAHCVCILGRTIYAGLGDGGYLVACDLDSGKVTVLASAARREGSPLDNTGNLMVCSLTADPDRSRVLMTARVNRTDFKRGERGDVRTGIWQVDGRTGQLTQLHQTYISQHGAWASPLHDGAMLLGWSGAVVKFDCRTDKVEPLQGMSETDHLGPNLIAHLDYSEVRLSTYPPMAFHDGWLWAGPSFRRVHLADRRLERFAPLEGKDGSARNFGVCLQFIERSQQVVLANSTSVWLLDFDPPAKPKP